MSLISEGPIADCELRNSEDGTGHRDDYSIGADSAIEKG